MKASAWITVGWVGFGANGGEYPELRVGVVALGCCRGSVLQRIRQARTRMLEVLAELRGGDQQ